MKHPDRQAGNSIHDSTNPNQNQRATVRSDSAKFVERVREFEVPASPVVYSADVFLEGLPKGLAGNTPDHTAEMLTKLEKKIDARYRRRP